MRKKLLLFIVLVAACICPAAAQGIVVHQTDGSMTIIPSAKVDHISLVEEEDTYVFGTWHLGFWKNGDNVTSKYYGRNRSRTLMEYEYLRKLASESQYHS